MPNRTGEEFCKLFGVWNAARRPVACVPQRASQSSCPGEGTRWSRQRGGRRRRRCFSFMPWIPFKYWCGLQSGKQNFCKLKRLLPPRRGAAVWVSGRAASDVTHRIGAPWGVPQRLHIRLLRDIWKYISDGPTRFPRTHSMLALQLLSCSFHSAAWIGGWLHPFILRLVCCFCCFFFFTRFPNRQMPFCKIERAHQSFIPSNLCLHI